VRQSIRLICEFIAKPSQRILRSIPMTYCATGSLSRAAQFALTIGKNRNQQAAIAAALRSYAPRRSDRQRRRRLSDNASWRDDNHRPLASRSPRSQQFADACRCTLHSHFGQSFFCGTLITRVDNHGITISHSDGKHTRASTPRSCVLCNRFGFKHRLYSLNQIAGEFFAPPGQNPIHK